MLTLDEAILSRRSVRKFKNTPVSDEALYKILDAGRMAPSAKNRQPWRFEVLSCDLRLKTSRMLDEWANDNRESRGTEKATAEIIEHAPAVIAVFSAVKNASVSDCLSIGACLENMSLKAVDLGLGSVIICDTQSIEQSLVDMYSFGAPPVALLAVGYPDDNNARRKKLGLDKLVRGLDMSSAPVDKNIADIVENLPEADISSEPFLFVSYSHKDSSAVLYDIIELKKSGVRLWYDKSIFYGKAWNEKALSVMQKHNCVGVLVYISDNAVQSESIAKELLCAREKFSDEASIIGIHIGDKPMSGYRVSPPLRDAFSCMTNEKKYVARSVLYDKPNTLPIVEQAERMGAVRASGVYDSFLYERTEGGIAITGYIGCSESVVFPSVMNGYRVVRLGKSVLRGNTTVREAHLPNGIKIIDEGAFFETKNLSYVKLPDDLEYLGVAAFRGCTSLKCVELPKGLTVLSEALFRDCTALETCDVPYGVKEFGEAVFRGCSALKRVHIPDTVERMTEGGFYGCSALEELIIPEGIAGLEKQSFETCPLVNVRASGFHFVNGKAYPIDE